MVGISCSHRELPAPAWGTIPRAMARPGSSMTTDPLELGSLPLPRALPRAGGADLAPRLMRWLPIPVNHLPGNAAAGVYPNSSLLWTRCRVLGCRALARSCCTKCFATKNPKPHESSRVSCFIVTPNSGLPGVSVVSRTFPTNLQRRLSLSLV